MTALSAHFDSSEFRCQDGTEHPIDPHLLTMLEAVRAHFARPVHITSGYRSPAWNRRVGGASQSYHLTGQAADLQVEGTPSREVAAFCDYAFPQSGVGAYASWVHLDCRGYRARWGFPPKGPFPRGLLELGAGGQEDAGHDAAQGVLIESTKWAIARSLAELTVAWAWRALRDWRISPEELLDAARTLLDFAERLRRESVPSVEAAPDA